MSHPRTIPAQPAASDSGGGRLRAYRAGLTDRLFEGVDIAPLAYFRILFGTVMLWEVCRYFAYGWISAYYVDPVFLFTYPGFGWVTPWGGNGMYLHFVVLGVLAACIALGLFYRVATTLFFLGFTYVFLLEQAHYLNHFYLICLVSFLMIFVPAHRAYALDALRGPRQTKVAAWSLWLLRFQLGVAYVYGGLAKINPDWLRGEPMRMWLAGAADVPLIGPFVHEEWFVYGMSYGGLLFDLSIVPMLLWPRTRVLGVVMVAIFHITNSQVFSIGIFPWLMLGATPIFFPPTWRWLRSRTAKSWRTPKLQPRAQWLLLGGLGVYVALQLLVPFRHVLYPGNVSWTEEGHNFSWHMKLRDKRGTIRMAVVNPDTRERIHVDLDDYLTRWQQRKMRTQPEMIRQFSHFLAEAGPGHGWPQAEVRAEAEISLNGRPRKLLIDPLVNLAEVNHSWRHTDWIIPLETPLPNPVLAGR